MIITTEGAWKVSVMIDAVCPIWEECEQCHQEFRFPHLCRTHRLCGLCHPPL